MKDLTKHILPYPSEKIAEDYTYDEWLLTNGLGGYASGSITGLITRKYHGLLIAALPQLGRTAMLNQLLEEVILPNGSTYQLTLEENNNIPLNVQSFNYLKEFRLEAGLPVWIFEIDHILIEKRILFIHLQNTVHISYKLLTDKKNVQLKLQPLVHFRSHEAPVNSPDESDYKLSHLEYGYEISKDGFPPLRLKFPDTFLHEEEHVFEKLFYRLESNRGYESVGSLWSPGYFKLELSPQTSYTLVISTETWEVMNILSFVEALEAENERKQQLLHLALYQNQDPFFQALVVAADQFVITPIGRIEDKVRANASANEIRTIIAGYHWFTDWGRDTMIALEGLTLCTKRLQKAKWILRTFHYYIKDGLIPNMFPEGKSEGLYHTADATLWFFHALDRYVQITKDRETLRIILPALCEVIRQHIAGTKFGIGVDPQDGLLVQGAEGYQLTWMDAKVENWVVTPRRGKAVEINGLWYNALRLTEEWVKAEISEQAAQPYKTAAEKAYLSFNQRFWYAEGQYLYDIVDGEKGNDAACRPNQLLAISLKYAILEEKYWAAVLTIVQTKLLTPYGLRTLSSDHPDYSAKYDGNLKARDAAYHQGTVWAWLIGPFIDAWLKVNPGKNKEARKFLKGFETHLQEHGIGSISEIFDATEPYTPRGCIAQAWSVAEVLRCWLKTATNPNL